MFREIVEDLGDFANYWLTSRTCSKVVSGASEGEFGITWGTVKTQSRIKSERHGTMKTRKKSKTIKKVESVA